MNNRQLYKVIENEIKRLLENYEPAPTEREGTAALTKTHKEVNPNMREFLVNLVERIEALEERITELEDDVKAAGPPKVWTETQRKG